MITVGDETYTTRSRGERFQPAARPVAHGEYALVRHGDHTHLVYRVDQIDGAGPLPDEVHIPATGSFILLFKQHHGRARWTTEGDPPQALDVEGAEVVLIGASEEPAAEDEVASALAAVIDSV